MLQVEPELVEQFVANGTMQLSFGHMIDHGSASQLAHTAAECAGEQAAIGFWHMHDLLFERQHELWRADAALMSSWATEIGLDGTQMRNCLNDGATSARVEQLDQARREAGIRIRPTFDLNGEIIQGAIPFPSFVDRIQQAQN